jgi:hypothetical protein
VDGDQENCPAEFAGCFRPEAAIVLRHYLAELVRYSRDAWILCGPVPETLKPEVKP